MTNINRNEIIAKLAEDEKFLEENCCDTDFEYVIADAEYQTYLHYGCEKLASQVKWAGSPGEWDTSGVAATQGERDALSRILELLDQKKWDELE